MKHLLCIDYGDKHIGLAVATTLIAEPVATVLKPESLDHIQKLINEYNIRALVVGISEGQMAKKTREYAHELNQNFDLPIYFQDETLSSLETRKKMAQAQKKKSKRESKIDHYVATGILQDFIDEHSPLDELPKADRMN